MYHNSQYFRRLKKSVCSLYVYKLLYGLYDVMRVGSLFDLSIRVMYERLKWVGMYAAFMMALKSCRITAMTDRGVFFRTSYVMLSSPGAVLFF